VKFAPPGRAANQKVVVSAVFVAAMFMNIMDGTVVNVALPTLSRYFGAPIGSVSGVVTAYLVALAVAMPASRCAGWRPRCPSWSRSARCRASAAGCSSRSG
jgi:MFS family permease